MPKLVAVYQQESPAFMRGEDVNVYVRPEDERSLEGVGSFLLVPETSRPEPYIPPGTHEEVARIVTVIDDERLEAVTDSIDLSDNRMSWIASAHVSEESPNKFDVHVSEKAKSGSLRALANRDSGPISGLDLDFLIRRELSWEDADEEASETPFPEPVSVLEEYRGKSASNYSLLPYKDVTIIEHPANEPITCSRCDKEIAYVSLGRLDSLQHVDADISDHRADRPSVCRYCGGVDTSTPVSGPYHFWK